ncbi:MAG: IS21-like element helper ATPase IstB [Elusimicrobiota bacterium]|nr:IS21-like element helper ATPase IstB [Elusimicrobiota bacterium]
MSSQSNEPVVLKEAPNTLDGMFSYLNLQASLAGYRGALAQAAKDDISHEEFLKRLLSQEASSKFSRQIDCRLAQAKFPCIKTLEQYDWNHPTAIPKAKILAAAELNFLSNREGFVFMSEHGLGKTHLAIAIGYRAVLAGVRTCFTKAIEMVNHLAAAQADHSTEKAMRFYTKPALLIIDEVGRLSIDQKQGEHIFNVIDARYERSSTILTTNRVFRDWSKVFEDSVCAKGIIDRLVHHSDVIKIEGDSYRVKDRKTKGLAQS